MHRVHARSVGVVDLVNVRVTKLTPVSVADVAVVDGQDALVVVVVPRQHQLHLVLAHDVLHPTANPHIAAVSSAAVGGAVNGENDPGTQHPVFRLVGLLQVGTQPTDLIRVVVKVVLTAEVRQVHGAEIHRPPVPGLRGLSIAPPCQVRLKPGALAPVLVLLVIPDGEHCWEPCGSRLNKLSKLVPLIPVTVSVAQVANDQPKVVLGTLVQHLVYYLLSPSPNILVAKPHKGHGCIRVGGPSAKAVDFAVAILPATHTVVVGTVKVESTNDDFMDVWGVVASTAHAVSPL
mmetsp:Transcript_37191/g.66565  ORF Transcript_37191/g.66565 Transcript_37191/m.66565 type:complete len:290 (+) Transcript_37191:1071-1940(+)